jgi:hypothetical protein
MRTMAPAGTDRPPTVSALQDPLYFLVKAYLGFEMSREQVPRLGEQGNLPTHTVKALTEEEYRRILSAV